MFTFCFLSAFAPTRTKGPFVFLVFLGGDRVEHFNASLAFCTLRRMYCVVMGEELDIWNTFFPNLMPTLSHDLVLFQ